MTDDDTPLCESLAVVFNTTLTCNLHEGHRGPHVDYLNDPDGDPATIIITWHGDYSCSPSDPPGYTPDTTDKGDQART